MTIKENVQKIQQELPLGVELVAAVKGRTAVEVLEAIEAGIRTVGENYIQEAEALYATIGNRVQWHCIGHLQKNKVKKAVAIFDMIETIDSPALAEEADRHCRAAGKIMPVLIEVNSGREPQKSGVFPEDTEALVRSTSHLANIRVSGLMTMGPLGTSGDEIRPYFTETRQVFRHIKELALPGVDMKYLSMGMSDSYRVAIEEGANIVRIGTKLFV
jgi:pyridoxal phosphate enzyme (YggS family)